MTTIEIDADRVGEGTYFDSSPDSVAHLLAEHRGQLLGLAVSLVRDREAAADVVQDVSEAVFRLGPTFASAHAALAFARTSVVNRSRSVLRRRMTARRYLASHVPDPPAPGADVPVLVRAQFAEVLTHFYRLPRRQREVLALRYFSSLSDAEIATTLQITPSTVRASATRALRSLTESVRKNSND